MLHADIWATTNVQLCPTAVFHDALMHHDSKWTLQAACAAVKHLVFRLPGLLLRAKPRTVHRTQISRPPAPKRCHEGTMPTNQITPHLPQLNNPPKNLFPAKIPVHPHDPEPSQSSSSTLVNPGPTPSEDIGWLAGAPHARGGCLPRAVQGLRGREAHFSPNSYCSPNPKSLTAWPHEPEMLNHRASQHSSALRVRLRGFWFSAFAGAFY